VERGVTGLVSTAEATARAPSTDPAGPNDQGRRSPRAATYSRVCGDSHKDSAGGEVDRRPRAVPDRHQHADPTMTHLRRRRCSRPTDAGHRCRGDSTQVTSIVHLQSTGDACDRPEVVALKVGGSSPLGHPKRAGLLPSPVAMATGRRPPMPTECPAACQAEAHCVTAGGPDNAHSLRQRPEAPPGRAVDVAPQLCSPEGGRRWNRSRRRSVGGPARSLDHLDAVVVAQVPKGPLGVLAGCAPLDHRSVAVVMERPERPNWCGSGLTIGSALARYRAVPNR
jgi:hypothetical protein